MAKPKTDLAEWISRIPEHVAELPPESASPIEHYTRGANDSWNIAQVLRANGGASTRVQGTVRTAPRTTALARPPRAGRDVRALPQGAERKSHSQRFIEKFARFYTPSVVAASFLLVLIPVVLLRKPFDPWFIQALTLLIISCPCALVISTPVTIFSAIGNATQRGALIKGGRFIERWAA